MNNFSELTISQAQIFNEEGTNNTVFANIVDIAKHMNRTPSHLIQFLFSKMETTGSIDENQRLIINGQFQQTQIENILKLYIVEYVTCQNCRSADTSLLKNDTLCFSKCVSCDSN